MPDPDNDQIEGDSNFVAFLAILVGVYGGGLLALAGAYGVPTAMAELAGIIFGIVVSLLWVGLLRLREWR